MRPAPCGAAALSKQQPSPLLELSKHGLCCPNTAPRARCRASCTAPRPCWRREGSGADTKGFPGEAGAPKQAAVQLETFPTLHKRLLSPEPCDSSVGHCCLSDTLVRSRSRGGLPRPRCFLFSFFFIFFHFFFLLSSSQLGLPRHPKHFAALGTPPSPLPTARRQHRTPVPSSKLCLHLPFLSQLGPGCKQSTARLHEVAPSPGPPAPAILLPCSQQH